MSMFWCRRLRRPPRMPYQFFIAAVYFARLWCLATGTLITLSASTSVVKTGHSSRTSPLMRIVRKRCSGREDDLGAERVRRPPDARALEAAVRVVARAVGDDDLLRARVEGEPDDRGDDLGVRVGGVDGHAVPADVGLDDDDVAAARRSASCRPSRRPRAGRALGSGRRVRRASSAPWPERARWPARRDRGAAIGDAKIADLTRALDRCDVEPARVPVTRPSAAAPARTAAAFAARASASRRVSASRASRPGAGTSRLGASGEGASGLETGAGTREPYPAEGGSGNLAGSCGPRTPRATRADFGAAPATSPRADLTPEPDPVEVGRVDRDVRHDLGLPHERGERFGGTSRDGARVDGAEGGHDVGVRVVPVDVGRIPPRRQRACPWSSRRRTRGRP